MRFSGNGSPFSGAGREGSARIPEAACEDGQLAAIRLGSFIAVLGQNLAQHIVAVRARIFWDHLRHLLCPEAEWLAKRRVVVLRRFEVSSA